MNQDTISGIVVATVGIGFLGLFGMAGWWWRQRMRFARGANPVLTCAMRRRSTPWGFGWHSGQLKLTADTMLWRGYWSFRTRPQLILSRHNLRFLNWAEPSLQSFLAMSGGKVLHLEHSAEHLRLALFPPDAELFLEWLGVQAERPPRRSSRLASIVLWFGGLAVVSILGAVMTGERLFPLAVGIPVVMILAIGSLVTIWVRIRQSRPEILKDEFVSEVKKQFGFLNDFGFRDVRVRYLPWSVVVIFGAPDRLVRLGLNRRQQRLALEIERRGDRPQNLRDLLVNSGHPDPDRVTRFQGVDGPMREALAANAHALRLWGRTFLIDRPNG